MQYDRNKNLKILKIQYGTDSGTYNFMSERFSECIEWNIVSRYNLKYFENKKKSNGISVTIAENIRW
jgi:hypothetical protein